MHKDLFCMLFLVKFSIQYEDSERDINIDTKTFTKYNFNL